MQRYEIFLVLCKTKFYFFQNIFKISNGEKYPGAFTSVNIRLWNLKCGWYRRKDGYICVRLTSCCHHPSGFFEFGFHGQ